MSRRRLVCAVVLSLMVLAGAALPASGASPEPRFGQHGGYVPAPSMSGHSGASPTMPSCADGQHDGCAPPLVYGGGPIMPNNTVYAIFWAPSGFGFPAGYKDLVEQYFTDVAADDGRADNPYGVTPQYTDTGGDHADYATTYGGAFDDTDAYPTLLNQCHNPTPDLNNESVCIWDDPTVHHQIHDEVQAFATAQHLTMDASHIFFMFFPPGVTSCDDLPMSQCAYTGYCAYHEFADGTTDPLYANMPYAGDSTYGTPCFLDVDQPNGNPADYVLSATSHEQIETITDPQGDAWVDSGGFEIGDECAYYYPGLQGTAPAKYTNTINGHNYLIQSEYSNAVGGTAVHGCEQQAQLMASFIPPANATTAADASFDASGSVDGEGTDAITSYDWDFGDGSAHGSGVTPTHRYASSGTYTVTLTVTDSKGMVDRASTDVPVANAPTPSATNVAIAGRPNPQVRGHAVRFTVTVTSGSGTPTGTVTLFQNGHSLGTKTLVGGSASFRTTRLTAGRHRITANYSGDTTFQPSSGSMSRAEVIRRP